MPKLPQHFIHLTIDQVFVLKCCISQDYPLWCFKAYNTVVWLTQQLEYCSIVADHVKSGAAAIARGPVSIQLAGQYLAAKKHIIHTKAPPLTHKKRDRRQNKIWENTNSAVRRVYSETDFELAGSANTNTKNLPTQIHIYDYQCTDTEWQREEYVELGRMSSKSALAPRKHQYQGLCSWW